MSVQDDPVKDAVVAMLALERAAKVNRTGLGIDWADGTRTKIAAFYTEDEIRALVHGTPCDCCGGTGEHHCGHECYACDAGGTVDNDWGPPCEGHMDRPAKSEIDENGSDYGAREFNGMQHDAVLVHIQRIFDFPIYRIGGRSEDIDAIGRAEHPNVDKYVSGGIGHRPGDESRSVVGFLPTRLVRQYREHDAGDDWNGQRSKDTVESIRSDIRAGKGITNPLTIDYDHDAKWGHLGEGNHRLQAAHEEGLKTVPVRIYGRGHAGAAARKRNVGGPMYPTKPLGEDHGVGEDYVPPAVHPHLFTYDHPFMAEKTSALGDLHRGIRIDLPSRDEFDSADHAGKAAIITKHLQGGAGMHWATDEDWAKEYATRFPLLSPPGRVHAVVTAKHPGQQHVETDPKTLVDHGVGQYQDEPEVPIKTGAPMHVKRVSWWNQSKDDPNDGTWDHHDVAHSVTAAFMAPYATEHVLDPVQPTERLFAATKGNVDPRLFDEDKEMRPAVRGAILAMVQAFFERHSWKGDSRDWARVYLAGSQASEWYGNNDFDILVGIQYAAFKAANPGQGYEHESDREISDTFNIAFRADFNDEQWHPPFDPENEWHLTGYVNLDSWDIRKIKPYAAYDVTNGVWAVQPIHEPEGHQFAASEWYYFEGVAQQVVNALALPEPRRTQRCTQIWQFIHSDRSRAFGPNGSGAFDRGNAVEKYLDQKGLMEPLQQARFGTQVTGSLVWDEIGEKHPDVYGDPEVHGEDVRGDGEGVGWAANHLAHSRPEDPEAEGTGSWDMEFHHQQVDPKHIDYARHGGDDPRVRHARQGYRTGADVPPLVLVHRHGVYQVADGHHRAEAAHLEGKKVDAYVAQSPYENEPHGDGKKAPYHGAEPTDPLRHTTAANSGLPWFAHATEAEIDAHHNPALIRDSIGKHVSPQGHNYRLVQHSGNLVTAHYMGKGESQVKNPQHVGALSWFSGSKDDDPNATISRGRIWKAAVKPAHQRRGVASAMLDFAREKNPDMNIRHSTVLSDDAKAWAEKKASLPKTQKCEYCAEQATKRIIHAEGMAYVPVCDSHVQKAIDDVGPDEVCGKPRPIEKTARFPERFKPPAPPEGQHANFRGLYLGPLMKSTFHPPVDGKGIGHHTHEQLDPMNDEHVLSKIKTKSAEDQANPNFHRWPVYGSHWTQDHGLARQFSLDAQHGQYRNVRLPRRSTYGVVLEAHTKDAPQSNPTEYGEAETHGPLRGEVTKMTAHLHHYDPDHRRGGHQDTYVRSIDVPQSHWKIGKAAQGVEVAGLCLKAEDTGRVLLLQRSNADKKDPARGTWEFPGGHMDKKPRKDGGGYETPLEAAQREFCEETGAEVPEKARLAGNWVNGIYQGFVMVIKKETDLDINLDHEDRSVLNPDDPDGDGIEVVAWWEIDHLPKMPALREEVRKTPWEMLEKACWDTTADPVKRKVAQILAVSAANQPDEYISHHDLAKMYSGDYDVPMTQHLREATQDWREGNEPHPGWGAHGSPRAHVDHLKKDIAQNGIQEPLEIRGGNVVRDGHHRGVAAMELGLDRIPVKHYAGLTLTAEDHEWRMNHRPGGPSEEEEQTAAPAHAVDKVFPGWYEHPEHYDHSSGMEGGKQMGRELTHTLRSIKGKPDAPVTMYRSLPPEHAHKGFQTGDWVSLHHGYAAQHGMHPDDPSKDWPVIKATVPAKHLWNNGDMIDEFGYHGPPVQHGGTVSASAQHSAGTLYQETLAILLTEGALTGQDGLHEHSDADLDLPAHAGVRDALRSGLHQEPGRPQGGSDAGGARGAQQGVGLHGSGPRPTPRPRHLGARGLPALPRLSAGFDPKRDSHEDQRGWDKDVKGLDGSIRKRVDSTIDKIRDGASGSTHNLAPRWPGWSSTNVDQRTRVIHATNATGGVHLGGIVTAHDYDKTMRRLGTSPSNN